MNIWKCADCGSLDLGQDAVINPNHLNKNGGSLIHEEDICWLDEVDRKSTRLNSSHSQQSRMPSSA